MSTNSPTIPPQTARHVLWFFGADGGTQPGNFTMQLLRLIGYARHDDHAKLAALYPAEAQAMRIGQLDSDGIKTLQAVAEGIAAYCSRCWTSDGPFTDDGLCEACARPMPLDGVA